MGTTGESATLNVDEHLAVIKRTIEVVAGQVPVIAGTGANSTSEAIELAGLATESVIERVQHSPIPEGDGQIHEGERYQRRDHDAPPATVDEDPNRQRQRDLH